jgi:3'(2'), 5'-bisphosphate nucleotidase
MTASELWSTLENKLIPLFAEYRDGIAELPIEVKADRTLLTEADVAIQALIVAAIREIEQDAVIIAEEDERTGVREDVLRADGRVWVIDPIDGTAQFVRADKNEFCSVVCLLQDWQPKAAFVLAPELGADGGPVVVTGDSAKQEIIVNGRPAEKNLPSSSPWLSVTRSGGVGMNFDKVLVSEGYRLKTKTSSQSLDMVRTAIDLTGVAGSELPGFELFWRRRQKVWDGLAGMCLGKAAGLEVVDMDNEQLRCGPGLLSEPAPVFESTVMGDAEVVAWFTEIAR